MVLVAAAVLLCCYPTEGCRRLGRRRLMAELRKRGKGPLGAFNKNYMAFTLKEAHAFPNLVNQRRFRSIESRFRRSPSGSVLFARDEADRFPITRTGRCRSVVNGFLRTCPACPAFTDLGPEVVPRFINEVLCPNTFSFCQSGTGVCKNTVLLQTFLRRECGDDDEEEELVEFTQEIRTCCECCLFSWCRKHHQRHS